MASPPIQLTRLTINGDEHALALEPRRTLLDALRVDLGLTGTKKVCDMGDCGACTVIVDGRAMYSCLLLAVDCEGREITTVEGLATGSTLDPVQQAFVEADAFQCGFCTSGQIMSLKALLDENARPTDDEIKRSVTGNLCRCGAYQNIARAGRIVADRYAAERSNSRTGMAAGGPTSSEAIAHSSAGGGSSSGPARSGSASGTGASGGASTSRSRGAPSADATHGRS